MQCLQPWIQVRLFVVLAKSLDLPPGSFPVVKQELLHGFLEQQARVCGVEVEGAFQNGKGFKVTGFTIDYTKCMFCALCVEPCPVDCIFMGATHDLSCYSRDGCIVDFSRLPVEVAWGKTTLNPTAVSESKLIVSPVHGGPNQ